MGRERIPKSGPVKKWWLTLVVDLVCTNLTLAEAL